MSQPSAGSPYPAFAPAPRPENPNLINGSTTHGIIGRRAIRHPWELPMLGVGVLVTAVAYLLWLTMIVLVIVGLFTGDTRLFERLVSLPFMAQILILVPLLPPLLWWIRAMTYAQMRTSAVRMSPTQFPEGYRIVVEAAQRYGMRKVPDAYVAMGNGMVNAFAAGHGFRRFVVIYSDLFEVGGAPRDPDALRFVIGHEVGHLAAGHTSYFRLVFANLMMQIPLLGPTYSRAQEYTADNFGYWSCPEGAPGVMGLLSGGKYLNAEVNVHELADRAATDPSLFVHLANLQSSHPVTTWRAHALRDRSKPGSMIIRPSGALFEGPLPAGSTFSGGYPSPADALAMLDRADQLRPAGHAGQFGRFNGADYSDRPSIRELQTSVPLLATRTSYAIPHGPYRDDARRMKPSFAPPPQGPVSAG